MRSIFILLVMLCVAGCAEKSSPFAQSKKDSLRALLDSRSGIVVPKDKEDDFFEVIEVFAESRRPDEFVRRVDFTSRSEATLLFTDGGMHGGGNITLRKKSGRWMIAQKLYFL